jgi:hypothetical protein
MYTILYNIDTNKVIGSPRKGYYTVDGIRPELDYPIIELELYTEPQPLYNKELEYLSKVEYASIPERRWITSWEIVPLPIESEYEVAIKNWIYLKYSKRIIAPIGLVMEDVGIKMLGWFQVNQLPVVKMGTDSVALYCNEILPQHQNLVDSLQGIITIEDRPEPE